MVRTLLTVFALMLCWVTPVWAGAGSPAGDPAGVSDLSGRYATTGTNPGGAGSYTGTTEITRTADGGYALVQRVGADTFTGTGTVEGTRLDVQFNSGIRASYVLQANGVLSGTWTATGNPQTGQETLTPIR